MFVKCNSLLMGEVKKKVYIPNLCYEFTYSVWFGINIQHVIEK